jgi:transcriptional regulator with XRE-family HTH domain
MILNNIPKTQRKGGNKLAEGAFYQTLKEVCQKKHTSPSAVCEKLEMSKSNVTNWKNGKYPRLDTVVEIANHLNVNPASLIPKER